MCCYSCNPIQRARVAKRNKILSYLCVQNSPICLIEPRVSNTAFIGWIQPYVSDTAPMCQIQPHKTKKVICVQNSPMCPIGPMCPIEPNVSNTASIGYTEPYVSNTATVCPIHPLKSKNAWCDNTRPKTFRISDIYLRFKTNQSSLTDGRLDGRVTDTVMEKSAGHKVLRHVSDTSTIYHKHRNRSDRQHMMSVWWHSTWYSY